ncbi:MAG: 2,3-bisphosphoglycerate-independent phosphoglycerate mutase [Wenzhouxiangellaceae bacterium]|nr:2,3-bisphosphoglycerate-independent phosphoglycerate mutase [Wenzhouxiangellaceae bacterium]
MERRTPLLLLILDGWGVREGAPGNAPDNAIAAAHTPNWERLWRDCPHALLETAGEAVGLPAGQMGNSEVGHMNIGAGRIVYQELTRIGRAIETGEFDRNPALLGAIDAAGDGTVHVMGLLSPGGVHSHEEHLFAAIRLAAGHHAGRVAVHAFLDGRDTPPRSASGSVRKLESLVAELEHVSIASVAGRYWAMDRDRRWNRTRRAYDAIVHAQAEYSAATCSEALEAAYRRDENDEFVQPTVIASGVPVRDGDSAIFVNFRADRARQLSHALVDDEFDGFDGKRPKLAKLVTMTQYEADLDVDVAFPPAVLQHLLGQELADAGIAQLRIAETEKYAHVTYFFNGGREQVFDGEDRKLIPSPDVATYDLKPEMSAPELTRELVAAIESGKWPVIVCNVANPDMVGHTGKFDAAVAAVEAVDRLLGEVMEAVDGAGGEMLVTADHGNVEQMADPETGQAHTAHTTNPVPFVYRGRPAALEPEGSLRDIAPTMLALLGLPVPDEMTGRPLVRVETRRAGAAATAGDAVS